MFKLNPAPTFRHEVAIPTPTGPVPLDLEFRHKGKEALIAWSESFETQSDLQIIADIVVGWSGVIDDSGTLVPWSSEALAKLLDSYPTAARAIFEAYKKVMREGREKN